MQTAKGIREVTKENDFRFKLLSLQKWDYIRMKRGEYEDNIAERLRQRQQMTQLLIHAFKNSYVKTIWGKFEERRAHLRLHLLRVLCISRIKKCMGLHTKRSG